MPGIRVVPFNTWTGPRDGRDANGPAASMRSPRTTQPSRDASVLHQKNAIGLQDRRSKAGCADIVRQQQESAAKGIACVEV
jgi:hypothetical protein